MKLPIICDTHLWDVNNTFHTGRLDFTPCFEHTILIWVPIIVFWLFTPVEIYYIRNSPFKNICWNALNKSKMIVTSLLVTLSFVEILYYTNEENRRHNALMYSITPFLKLLCFILSSGLIAWNRINGYCRSGLLFWLWMFLTICGVVQLCREIMQLKRYGEGVPVKLFDTISYVIYYCLVVVNSFLTFLRESLPREVKDRDSLEGICPDSVAPYPAAIWASWVRPILRLARKRIIHEDDLFDLREELKAKPVLKRFKKKYFEAETLLRGEHSVGKKSWIILIALLKCFGDTFAFGSLLLFVYIVLYYGGPQILKLLLIYAERGERRLWENVCYPTMLFVLAISLTILISQYDFKIGSIALKTRVILNAEIFKKSLKLTPKSRWRNPTGQVINLMNVDVQRIAETIQHINMIWGIPLRIFLAMYSLYVEIGGNLSEIEDLREDDENAALVNIGDGVIAAFLVLVSLLTVQITMGYFIKNFTAKMMELKDRRMRILSEALSNIEILKFFSWEPSFIKIINELRMKEIVYLRKIYYVHIINVFLATLTPYMMTLASFSYYVIRDERVLTAEVAFVSLVLVELLQVPLSLLPSVLVGLMQLDGSYRRIGRYLDDEELTLDLNSLQCDGEEIGTASIVNGYFAWEETIVLREIYLSLPKGCMKAIFGPVGSGKSSLLAALCGEMIKMNGSVSTKGQIALVEQTLWLPNESVREVILFGKSYDEELYIKTIEACGLLKDFRSLANGDLTIIGTKGLTLSQGQKQRISLARAVYSGADLYILDDPTSSLDEHLTRSIYKRVISNRGLLAGKTRVVVTRNLDYLHYFDKVVLMENGKIVEEETYERLVKTGRIAYLLRKWGDSKPMGGEEGHGSITVCESSRRIVLDRSSFHLNRFISSRNFNPGNLHLVSSGFVQSNVFATLKANSTPSGHSSKMEFDEDEIVFSGKVKYSNYTNYLKKMGHMFVNSCLLFALIYELSYFSSTYWLVIWTRQSMNQEIDRNGIFYLTIFALLGVGQISSLALFSFSMYMGALKATKSFHDELLNSVLKFPMSFFDTNPLGRVLNRFGGDVYTLDSELPLNLQSFVSTSFRVLGLLLVSLFFKYQYIVFPIFMSLIASYLLLQNYYSSVTRQLSRMEAKSRSPLYSHFQETLSGLDIIRAFGATDKFIGINYSNMERNISIIFHYFDANRWLQMRMETIANVILFSFVICVIFNEKYSAPMVGLAFSYAIQMAINLNILVRYNNEVNSNFISVERINEYIEMPQEAIWKEGDIHVPSDWPEFGGIKFQNLVVKYESSSEFALKGISFDIKPGEKISIVGRTGSGKSTIVKSLFRIIEGRSGSIYIDGFDISRVSLGRLRSSLNIIPQDPVLFSGTLRMNLDPGQKFSDGVLWEVIKECHLGYLRTELQGGLDHVIEGDESFSLGERQMICIARALLKETNILIIDEGTANIDWLSEVLIRNTIKTHFSHCTIIAIDHRLKYVLDSDRVLVLSNGLVTEFDNPKKLLEDQNSVFYALALEAGIIIPEQKADGGFDKDLVGQSSSWFANRISTRESESSRSIFKSFSDEEISTRESESSRSIFKSFSDEEISTENESDVLLPEKEDSNISKEDSAQS